MLAMPDIGQFHPQIVHFVIALGGLGIVLRWVALTGKLSFTGPAATTLLLIAAVAAVLAVQSGQDAHEAVERIPGVGMAVRPHEEWGERLRLILLVIGGLELVGLLLKPLPTFRRIAFVASGLVGLVGIFGIYRTGELGGQLVYSYAGGPGLRTGDTTDIERLYIAGVYEQAMVDRARHQSAEAAGLIDQLAAAQPHDTAIALLRVESLLRDRQDPKGALAALDSLHLPTDNPRLALRTGMLKADALEAAGEKDSAIAVMRELVKKYPGFQRLQDRLKQLGG
jgi:uncharacterized membrane protein